MNPASAVVRTLRATLQRASALLAIASVASAQVGCYSWVPIKPTELEIISSPSDRPSSGTYDLERPDGHTTQVERDYTLKVERTDGQTSYLSPLVTIERETAQPRVWWSDNVVLAFRSSQSTEVVRIPADQIALTSVRQYDHSRTGWTVVGVLAGVTLFTVMVAGTIAAADQMNAQTDANLQNSFNDNQHWLGRKVGRR